MHVPCCERIKCRSTEARISRRIVRFVAWIKCNINSACRRMWISARMDRNLSELRHMRFERISDLYWLQYHAHPLVANSSNVLSTLRFATAEAKIRKYASGARFDWAKISRFCEIRGISRIIRRNGRSNILIERIVDSSHVGLRNFAARSFRPRE